MRFFFASLVTLRLAVMGATIPAAGPCSTPTRCNPKLQRLQLSLPAPPRLAGGGVGGVQPGPRAGVDVARLLARRPRQGLPQEAVAGVPVEPRVPDQAERIGAQGQ